MSSRPLMPVRGTIHKVEAAEYMGEMSSDLARLLDLVWSNRLSKNIRTGEKNWNALGSYRLYCREAREVGIDLVKNSKGRVIIDQKYVRQFLKQLVDIKQTPELQLSTNDPRYPPFVAIYGKPRPPDFTRDKWKKVVDDAQKDDELADLLSKSFFHFVKAYLPARERIYLHVRAECRVAVMQQVLNWVSPLRGFAEAKVAPPALKHRFDSIVIYLTDKEQMQFALSWIANIQADRTKQYRSLFEEGTPRMLRVIDQWDNIPLTGVAVGAEPTLNLKIENKNLVSKSGNSSFGAMRTTIIDWCLLQTYKATKKEFVELVLKTFPKCNIDPKQPYL